MLEGSMSDIDVKDTEEHLRAAAAAAVKPKPKPPR
jgi:hypothetical protein